MNKNKRKNKRFKKMDTPVLYFYLIYLHLEETQLVCVYDKNPMMMLSTC